MPTEGSQVILAFRSLFSKKVFEHVKVLLLGAVLTVGKHTVCAALRFMGLEQQGCFHKYHRVLSRVNWSGLNASKILLHILIKCFVNSKDPLVFGIDETIERRRGTKLNRNGLQRTLEVV